MSEEWSQDERIDQRRALSVEKLAKRESVLNRKQRQVHNRIMNAAAAGEPLKLFGVYIYKFNFQF